MSLVTSALAYLWYSFTRSRRTLFVAVAFLVLGANQFVFAILIPASAPSAVQNAYFLIASRLIAGVLLLIGAADRPGAVRPAPHPLSVFLSRWRLSPAPRLRPIHDLVEPPATSSPVLRNGKAGSGTIAPGLTPTAIGMCVVIVVLYLSSALLFLPSKHTDMPPHGDWLSAALVVAVFVQVHFLLLSPVLSAHELASSDLLRLLQYSVLFFGFLWEVRLLLRRERDRSEELSNLHAARDEAQRLISHDLLHSIATLTSLTGRLSVRWNEMSVPQREDSATRIYRQSFRLNALAEDTLITLTSDNQARSLALRPEAVTDVVDAVVDSTGSLGGRMHVRMAPEAPEAVVMGNMVALCRVLLNLVWNAEEHSSEGSPIIMWFIYADQSTVRFSVTDVGEGISRDELEDLLDGAWPSSASSSAVRGLGLRSSRAIVDSHGGRLSAQSQVGEGSTFVVTIPRWRPVHG